VHVLLLAIEQAVICQLCSGTSDLARRCLTFVVVNSRTFVGANRLHAQIARDNFRCVPNSCMRVFNCVCACHQARAASALRVVVDFSVFQLEPWHVIGFARPSRPLVPGPHFVAAPDKPGDDALRSGRWPSRCSGPSVTRTIARPCSSAHVTSIRVQRL